MKKSNEQPPGGAAALENLGGGRTAITGGDIGLFGVTRAIAQFKMPNGAVGFAHVDGGEPEGAKSVRRATVDDFPDDCPICELMRARIRAGEEIEVYEFEL